MENKVELYMKRMRTALLGMRYAEAARWKAKLDAELNRKEWVSVREIADKMTEQDREKAKELFMKILAYGDLLETAAIEFGELMKKQCPGIEIDIVEKAREAARRSRDITRHVDKMGCWEMSEDFGEMCDQLGMMCDDVICKHVNKEFKDAF